MRSRFAILKAFLWRPVIVTVFVLLLTDATRAGATQSQGNSFDPRDLSGIYVRTGGSDRARQRHPERFVNARRKIAGPPDKVWINPPAEPQAVA